MATQLRPINKILIANRGEIVLRVIRTCKRMGKADWSDLKAKLTLLLGILTVAIFSDADRNSPFVKEASMDFPLYSFRSFSNLSMQTKLFALADQLQMSHT